MTHTILIDSLHFGASVGWQNLAAIQRFSAGGAEGGVMAGTGVSGSETRPIYLADVISLSKYGAVRINSGQAGNATPAAWLQAAVNTTGQTTLALSAHTIWIVLRVPSTTTAFTALTSKNTSPTNGTTLAVNEFPTTNNGVIRTYNNGAASGDLNDGSINIIILSLSGTNQRMTVNGGTAIVSASGPSGRAAAGSPLLLGAVYTGSSYLYGGQYDLIAWGATQGVTYGNTTHEAQLYTELYNRYTLGNTRCVGAVGYSIMDGSSADGYPGSDANAAFTKLVSQLTTSTGDTWTGVNMGVGGSSTTDWLPGTANYIAALAAFRLEGVTYINLMLGTNNTASAKLTPAATYGSELRQIAEGFRADLPCLTGIMIHYPATAHEGGSNGGDALMQIYFPEIDAICNDAFYVRGDTTAYAAFEAAPGTYKPGDNLHPVQIGHDFLADAWEDRFLATFDTGVGVGRIAAGSPTSDSVSILSVVDPISYAAPGATIASCGAQYSTNGGGAWSDATWTPSANIFSGVASGLPSGTTHVRRKATDSLGNISHSDKVAVMLSSGGGGGGAVDEMTVDDTEIVDTTGSWSAGIAGPISIDLQPLEGDLYYQVGTSAPAALAKGKFIRSNNTKTVNVATGKTIYWRSKEAAGLLAYDIQNS